MTAITVKKPDNKDLVQCSEYDRMILPGRRYCEECSWHPGGPVCWSCNPEQAPDTWPHKEAFVEKKKTKTKTAQISFTT
jgi:hypothetical protein